MRNAAANYLKSACALLNCKIRFLGVKYFSQMLQTILYSSKFNKKQ